MSGVLGERKHGLAEHEIGCRHADHPATVKHVWEAAGPLNAPTLQACGFFTACQIPFRSGWPFSLGARYVFVPCGDTSNDASRIKIVFMAVQYNRRSDTAKECEGDENTDRDHGVIIRLDHPHPNPPPSRGRGYEPRPSSGRAAA